MTVIERGTPTQAPAPTDAPDRGCGYERFARQWERTPHSGGKHRAGRQSVEAIGEIDGGVDCPRDRRDAEQQPYPVRRAK